MHLNTIDLEYLLNIAKKAAILAGEIVNSHQGSKIEVQTKEGGENIASQVVTQIDLNAQKIIIDTLSPAIKKFDLGLLAEESEDNNSRFKKDYFWCIDPLDGTLAFSKNEDGYSVSIALVSKDGVPMIGVVFNPRANDLYYAIKDNGAFKNDRPFKVENKSGYLTLLYDQSFLKIANFDKELDRINQHAKSLKLEGVELHHLGGAVMNGISTIELAPAIYYKHPKREDGGGSIWDFAASSVIQAEAGGYNSDYYNDPLDLNKLNSTFMNTKGVIFCSSLVLMEHKAL